MRHFWPSQFDGVGSTRSPPPREPAHAADNSFTVGIAPNSRLVRWLIIFGIVLVGAIIAATGVVLLNLRDRELAESERELNTLAFVLAEQLDRSFQSIEIIQTVVIERIQSLGITSAEDYERKMSGHDTYQRLKDQISALPHINAIVLTDPQGKLINFSRSWPLPSLTIPNEDPAKAFKSEPRLTFYVGDPLHSPATGNWVVPIARKVTGPNGEFLGVVIAVMELQYFEQLFEAIVPTQNSSIALWRRDGTLLVRYPRHETAIGQSFSGRELFANVLLNSDRATFRQNSVIDGKERLISARTLAHYPFVVVATVPVADAIAHWQSGTTYLAGAGVLMAFVFGGIILLIARQVHRKLRVQNLQIDTALNNMTQGLVMFDSEARLIICNDHYQQMMKLPPELVKPGCTMLDIFKCRLANGTFSGNPEQYIGDFMATIAQGKTETRELEIGDGRIVSIVSQPMAGGGWVATHEDITEAKRKKESFRLLFENNPVPMIVFELNSLRFLAVNDAAIEHYGYSREQFLAMTILDIRPPEERERIKQIVRTCGGNLNAEETSIHQKSDGTIIDVAIYARPLNYQGRAASIVAAIDITARKQAEDELRRTKKFLDTVIENVPVPIVVKDAHERRYTYVNRASEQCFGISRKKMIGKNAHEMFPKEEADAITVQDDAALQSDESLFTDTYSLRTPHNGRRLFTAKRVAINDGDGKSQNLVIALEDVTERRLADSRILFMAHYDALTELPNRVTFNDTMDIMIERAARRGEPFTLLSLDLDHFKEANDTYGHLTGDALLREVARRLQAAAEGAFIARIGGDEFMFIVTDGAQPAAAAALAERLLAAFVDDFEAEGHRLKLGLSIGGAVYPTDGADAITLIANADAALYRAKTEFRGSALFFEPEMGTRVRRRRDLQEDLQSAIERDELLLHYQPQKAMSGETVGFEALVRWQCLKRGMVPPNTFIPVAEESSLILPIGEWVLREACREAASWPQPLTIAVNISPIQFRHGDLPGLVHSVLLETGLSPGRLELEITESVMINDFSRAVSILNRLKSLGVKIAMDDFGTGYSSLSYLHSFTCDKLKIDRAFIGDLETNHHSRAIVRAIVGLGQSLKLPILAEGVETEAQHAFLVQEGCDEVQGYLTGRPQPIADYAELVGRQASAQQSYATAG